MTEDDLERALEAFRGTERGLRGIASQLFDGEPLGPWDYRGTWDVDRIAQVGTNLIVNALTYGAEGAAVKINLRDLGEDVELSVQNFGKAIPTQQHAPLFEAMHRGSHGEKDNGGLGLGLFIARAIVSAHGGDIQVSSSAEAGTTFTVRLPKAS